MEIKEFSALTNRPPFEPRRDCSAVAGAKNANPFNFQKCKIKLKEEDLLNADWFPPDAAPEEKPLDVSMEVLTDMVLHCHYITRA